MHFFWGSSSPGENAWVQSSSLTLLQLSLWFPAARKGKGEGAVNLQGYCRTMIPLKELRIHPQQSWRYVLTLSTYTARGMGHTKHAARLFHGPIMLSNRTSLFQAHHIDGFVPDLKFLSRLRHMF